MANKKANLAMSNYAIAHADGKRIGFDCKVPGCNGWNDCLASYDRKMGTLTVECTLCHNKTVAKLL